MKKDIIKKHHSIFESIRQIDGNGAEYWTARQLWKVLEYSEYQHFVPVIDKAKTACENSGQTIKNHFEGVDVVYGTYQDNTITCKRCSAQWSSPNEKMTDVNIATTMLFDPTHNNFDVAILVSGDSDLTPPLKIIKQYYPQKMLLVAFPPDRHNNTIAAVAKASFLLGRAKLSQAQFDDSIILKNGYTLTKPKTW